MGGKSSKYIKKKDYHAHFEHLQRLTEDLQTVQTKFSEKAKEKEQVIEQFMDEMKNEQRKQGKSLHKMEQQIITLKEKLEKLNELDVLKKILEKVSLEHTADRTQISSNLKNAICKEKSQWDEDILDLKKRTEGIRQFSSELVSLDLQHEREIHDIQKRIHELELKARYKSNFSTTCITSSRDDKEINQHGGKYHVTATAKDSAFISQQPSCLTGLEYCGLCTSAGSENFMTGKDMNKPSSSSSYHLKFSKINMAMKKLKDDIKIGELKKKSSLNIQKSDL